MLNLFESYPMLAYLSIGSNEIFEDSEIKTPSSKNGIKSVHSKFVGTRKHDA